MLATVVTLAIFPSLAACNPAEGEANTQTPAPAPSPNPNPSPNPSPGPEPEPGEKPSTSNIMKITIGNSTFTAALADNPTADAFKGLLPMTVEMTEHAGNEKFHDLPRALPAAASNPGTINNGDIMLFGSRTLVLFYKTFRTSYSYTRIGRVDNPAGLERALGTGRATVSFELSDETTNSKNQ